MVKPLLKTTYIPSAGFAPNQPNNKKSVKNTQ